VFDSRLEFWKAFLNMVISLEVILKGISCSTLCLTFSVCETVMAGFKA
jgi:hypothetical protein